MLDSNIQSSESSNVLKSRILKFIWPKVNSFLNYLYPNGVKLITGLQLGLSNLQNVKFKHSFQELSQPYYAVVVLKSKQLCIICFTVSTTYMKEKSFWIKSKLFFLIFSNKVTLLLIVFFSLVISLPMTLQMQLS